MTIPEAHEQLERLTVKLQTCTNNIRRNEIEKQIVRCYRIIQREQQRAHHSLVRVADILQSITEDLQLNELQIEAITLSAQLIHRSTTEQLAIAVSTAIIDQAANAQPARIDALLQVDSLLRSIYSLVKSHEQRLAIRAVLLLFSLTSKTQISQSVRRFQEHFDHKPKATQQQKIHHELVVQVV